MAELQIPNHNFLFPSLGTIAATRIVTHLCQFYIAVNDEKDQIFLISERIEQLAAPTKIKRRLLSLIRPLVAELALFKKNIDKYLPPKQQNWNFSPEDEFSISWTGFGLVDMCATSKSFFKSRRLPADMEFERACVNFAEVDIFRLWPSVEKDIIPFVDGLRNVFQCSKSTANHSVLFWGNYIKRGGRRSATLDLCFWKALFIACQEGNTSALKFLFEYVDYSHEPYIFLNTMNRPERDDLKMVHYLMVLLQSGKERVLQELFTRPFDLLISFLEWPLRDYFIKLTAMVQSQLRPHDFCCITQALMNKVSLENFETPIYQRLFNQWWDAGRLEYKEIFLNTKAGATLKQRPYTSFVFHVGVPQIEKPVPERNLFRV